MVVAIGNTPLLPLRRMAAEHGLPGTVELWLKGEWTNPGGSIKDRPALAIVRAALAEGRLGDGQTLLDSTSGNTGIAYAMLGAAFGFPVEIVLPANASEERRRILAAYGATVVASDAMEGSNGAIRLAREMAAADGDGGRGRYFYADQYGNPANPAAHEATTGPELWAQTEGRITHLVAGLGTTGTLMGVGRFLRERVPDVEIIAAEPRYGELVYGLRNLDEGFVPELYDESVLTSRYSVGPRDAVRRVRELLDNEGLFAGFSTGAIAHAALGIAGRCHQEGRRADIAFIVCDAGWKYLSTGAYAGTLDEAESRLDGQLWA